MLADHQKCARTCQELRRDEAKESGHNHLVSKPVFPPNFPPQAPKSASQSAAPISRSSTEGLTPFAGATPGVSPNLEEIVRIAYQKGHSDVHLGVGEVPRFRDRGEMQSTDWPVTDPERFQGWLQEILSANQIDEFFRSKEFDGSHAFPFARVRINLLDSLTGPAMVLRIIPQTILTLEQLQLPDVLKGLSSKPKGLVLVTGSTGSGKSTTLAAMIDWINRNQPRHILTIEDPVEFVHKSKQSLVKHRELGKHTLKFHNALKAALREDPDVILIGEIRDQETLATAIEASQTGHLVFGTLHTNSAVKTIERVLGMYAPEDQESMRRSLSESLLGVIAQGLIRTTDNKRAAYHDILINTDACKDYIQRGALEDVEEIMERSSFDGMITANQSLLNLVDSGRVEPEMAVAASFKPNELAQSIRGRN